jgi:hypothetical protein
MRLVSEGHVCLECSVNNQTSYCINGLACGHDNEVDNDGDVCSDCLEANAGYEQIATEALSEDSWPDSE